MRDLTRGATVARMSDGGPGAGSLGGCSATCGITRERARQQAHARALALAAHPAHANGPRSAHECAPTPDELDALATRIESVVPGRALVAAATDDEAPSVYVLAGLHRPSLREARDVNDPAEIAAIAPQLRSEETWLRVAFSTLDRFYTLQECVLSATRAGPGLELIERRCNGVSDRRLDLFVKALQGLLRASGFIALDAVFLSEPVPDEGRALEALIGTAATLRTLLFERAPAALESFEWLTVS